MSKTYDMTESSAAGSNHAPPPDAVAPRKAVPLALLDPRRLLRRAPRPEEVVGSVVFLLVTLTLRVPTLIGVADNGDFYRLMEIVGIQYPPLSDNLLYYGWVNRYYPLVVKTSTAGAYNSSTAILLALVAPVSEVLHGYIFDVALMGWLYTALFAFGAFLIVRGMRLLIPARGAVYAICLLGGFVFLDVAYTAYFNSLYSEPTAYVFLFISIGAALNLLASERPSYAMLAVFALSSLFFATSKLQNLPLALLMAVFMLWLMGFSSSRAWKATLVITGLLMVTCAGVNYTVTPDVYHRVDLYNTVFDGILKQTNQADARSMLRELGTSPSYVTLVGSNYFDPKASQVVQTPAFAAGFYQRVSTATVIRFYVTHPGMLVERLQDSAASATTMRPNYLGNFTRDAGKPAGAEIARMDLWSVVKARYFPQSLWVLLLGDLLYFVGIGWEYARAHTSRARALVALYALVGVMALVSFPIPYVFSGDYELVKHLFVFNMLCDLTLVIACGWIILKLFGARAVNGDHADTIEDEETAPLPAR